MFDFGTWFCKINKRDQNVFVILTHNQYEIEWVDKWKKLLKFIWITYRFSNKHFFFCAHFVYLFIGSHMLISSSDIVVLFYFNYALEFIWQENSAIKRNIYFQRRSSKQWHYNNNNKNKRWCNRMQFIIIYSNRIYILFLLFTFGFCLFSKWIFSGDYFFLFRCKENCSEWTQFFLFGLFFINWLSSIFFKKFFFNWLSILHVHVQVSVHGCPCPCKAVTSTKPDARNTGPHKNKVEKIKN